MAENPPRTCRGPGGSEMSVEEAVAVLNRVRHRGHSGWYLAGDDPGGRTVRGEDYYEFLTPFEAVAVASKYRVEGEEVTTAGDEEIDLNAEKKSLLPPLPPMVDGRTPEQLKADGDDRWPDGTPYTPPGRPRGAGAGRKK